MNIWVWKIRNNVEHSHVSGIMNKTFVYVLPDTFSTEALYLHDEIFVFVKLVGNLQKKTTSKLQTAPSETSH